MNIIRPLQLNSLFPITGGGEERAGAIDHYSWAVSIATNSLVSITATKMLLTPTRRVVRAWPDYSRLRNSQETLVQGFAGHLSW